MSFSVEKKDNYARVSIEAEKFDTQIAPSVKAQFVMLNNEGFKNIIIDLDLCRYCDSSGLSAVLIAHRICLNSGGICVICRPRTAVSKLIEISQLDSVLNVVPALDEAIQLIILNKVENEAKKEKKK